MEKYQNAALPAKERARDLLGKLSLEEKMSQVVCVMSMETYGIPALTERLKEACKYGIGGISTLEVRDIKTLEEVSAYQRNIQKMVMEQSPHHIPAVFHMEGLCGGFIQGATIFPGGIGRGASWDPELEREIGRVVARQERAVGFTQILAPVLDISRDSRMGRQGETYGEDPVLAASMGINYTRGIQEETRKDGLRADAVAKHFLGFHNSLGGIHGADSQTPERLLEEIYGKPFQAAIAEAGLKGIMPCYCTFDGEVASCSKRLLTKLLREKMGFEGVCVSDYSALENAHKYQGLYETPEETGLYGMKAGMDMEWPNRFAYNEELKKWFAEGKEDISIRDTLVERVLEAKFRMGLFEHPFGLEGKTLEEEFYHEKDQALALQSAEESMVLLKNDGILPIENKIRKIAVIGPHGKNARRFFGGYTHVSMQESFAGRRNSMAGIGAAGQKDKEEVKVIPGTQVEWDETQKFTDILKRIKPDCPNLVEELQRQLPDTQVVYAYGYPMLGNDRSYYEEALKLVEEAELTILTLGGKNGSGSISTMGEGVDSTDINLPKCQEEFILEASKKGKPLIGIHFNGRPISSDAAQEKLNAILEAWLPSEMGAQAVVNILSGKTNPSGRMPVSTAYNAGQIPVYYNHPNGSGTHQSPSIGFVNYVDCSHAPRYAFGYGLSYTSFCYENMQLNKKVIKPFEELVITCDVRNTGEREGTEVVQLYLRDLHASMVRPCLELQGFARIHLKLGEKGTVRFVVAPSQMAFLDLDMCWKIEKGEIEVAIGKASDQLLLKDSFWIEETAFVEGKDRRFIAAAEVSKQSM